MQKYIFFIIHILIIFILFSTAVLIIQSFHTRFAQKQLKTPLKTGLPEVDFGNVLKNIQMANQYNILNINILHVHYKTYKQLGFE